MRSLEQILRGAIALKASDILFSAGVPVVLCSDYLSSFGDGSILTERHDVADRIRQLLNDGDLLKELKQAARKNAVENFTWSKTAQKYFDNFNI